MKYYFYGAQNYKKFCSHLYCLVEPINPYNDQSKYLLNSKNCSSGFWDEIFYSNFFDALYINTTQLGTHLSKRYVTPPRTPRISGLDLETNIFELKMMMNSGLDFYFEIILAPSEILVISK